jgi:peptidylprolyl isomerase
MPILAACAAIAIAGCGGGDSTTGSETAESAPAAAESSATTKKPVVKSPKGAPPKQLEVKDLVEGSGEEAKSGDEITVDYVGVDYKSGKEFDSSWSRNEPFTFTLGAGEVIPGWDQGVEGMKVGGRRELIIPPELGYGQTGSPPAIPPNETLIFVIDLREVG